MGKLSKIKASYQGKFPVKDIAPYGPEIHTDKTIKDTMKTILFVDDKPAIGKVLSVYLGQDNKFIYFEDPIRAIEWLDEGNEPALVISDIHMPRMDGKEFLYYLKRNELFKHIPVVILSSEESTTERINLLEAGAEDFILKPFNPMELKARIKKYL